MPMGSACIGNPTISIHTALAGCDAVLGHSNVNTTMISIHTALAGCDGLPYFVDLWGETISIHTALAGCDGYSLTVVSIVTLFQSTQPSQAVTLRWADTRYPTPGFQSTQPSQAVTNLSYQRDSEGKFQSTQPSQAVTRTSTVCRKLDGISIHTALAGCDSNNTQQKPHSNRHNHIQCIYI